MRGGCELGLPPRGAGALAKHTPSASASRGHTGKSALWCSNHGKIRKTGQTKAWFTQNFQLLYPIQGGTMWKLTSWRFQKCGTFWVKHFLKGSYCLSKSTKREILGPLAKSVTVKKKRHDNNFDFWGPPLNQNCGRVFFLTPHFHQFFSWFLTRLRQPITPLQKLLDPKSTTFLESLGRKLSHDTPLVRV